MQSLVLLQALMHIEVWDYHEYIKTHLVSWLSALHFLHSTVLYVIICTTWENVLPTVAAEIDTCTVHEIGV